MMSWTHFFRTGRLMTRALGEQKSCIREVYGRLAPYLSTPPDTPECYRVRPGAVPDEYYSWRKNLFSTLFHAVYFLLECPGPRRRLYGQLIHLNRIWVTSADNLLDSEDKTVVPIEMPGSSRTMRQVVAVMAADRALAELLWDAVASGLITAEGARRVLADSLRSLLPSAAQEATEEGGIASRPAPEHVLEVVHRYKTGLLFNIAFVGPEALEPRLDRARVALLKRALMDFGLGCQLLDDVRDLGRDLAEGRHNYVLSWMTHRRPELMELVRSEPPASRDRLYLCVPQAALPAAELGLRMMTDGLAALGEAGMGFERREASGLASFMFTALDLKGLAHAQTA